MVCMLYIFVNNWKRSVFILTAISFILKGSYLCKTNYKNVKK